jgi:hypothetical protein
LYQEVQHLALIIKVVPRPFYQDASGRSPEAWRDAGCRRLAIEFEKPSPNDLLRDDDPSLRQHLLDVTERQRESRIEPNRVLDDVRRKTVALKRNQFNQRNIFPWPDAATIFNVPMPNAGFQR